MKTHFLAASLLVGLMTTSQATHFTFSQAQGFGTSETEPFPASFTPVSATDLANSNQATFSNLSGVDTDGRDDSVVPRLFDGIAGVGGGTEVFFNGGSVTVNFDVSSNVHGYDITGINTYAAWNNAGQGRSDQEYTLTAILVDGSEKEITSGTHYDNTPGNPNENGEINVWTEVKFDDPTGAIQKRVKALRFDFTDGANSGGPVAYTEFDIFGVPSVPRTFVHPGIGYTTDDLDSIKANLDREHWKSGYEQLLADSKSSLDYQMLGPVAEVGQRFNENQWESDMQAIRNQALIWYFTGDEAYAQNARDMLIAWATTHTQWLDGGTYLVMGYGSYLGFEGAELLRGAWSGWTAADTETCKTYFNDVWLNRINLNVPGPMRAANQGMAQYQAAINIAVFNDDEDLFDELLHIFRTDASSALPSHLPNGQAGDSGRDAHDQGQIMLWARSAETFWQQGVDVFSEYDQSMLAAGEYLARQNLGLETPFIQAGTVYDIYPHYHHFNIDEATGQLTGGRFQIPTDMTSMLYTAYITRLGLSSPYLEKYFSLIHPGIDWIYVTPSDTSTATRPDPVPEAAGVSSVTSLQTRNIGDANGGSASYDSNTGTWTVSGRGTRLESVANPDYRFAYLPVTGDATMIAQITSLNGRGNADARAGLVLTENLENTDIKMGGTVFTAPSNDDNLLSFFRGFTNASFQDQSNVKDNQARPRLPYWLKIERIGNRVTFFNSPDGANWSTSHVADMPMGARAYYGLAVSADTNNREATATFTNVRITGGDGGEAIEVPEAPFAIYASPAGDEITLRWLESFEADSYKIWRSTQAGGPYQLLTEENGTSFIDSNIAPNTYYYYTVSAVNAAGEGPRSPEESLRFIDDRYTEAEDFDDQSGVTVSEMFVTQDVLAGLRITNLDDGDWTCYKDTQIWNANPTFRVRAATFDDIGRIEIRVNSPTGPLIGSVTPNDSGRDIFWLTTDTNLTVQPGSYDLYLVYRSTTGTGSAGINLNWFDLVYPGISTVDLSLDESLTFNPTLNELSNDFGIESWTTSANQLDLRDGSNFTGIDFAELGVKSWLLSIFTNSSLETKWDNTNLDGITIIAGGAFGAGDSFTGANFTNIVWDVPTSSSRTNALFSGGPGTTSAADRDEAIDFSGADLSRISGQARTAMINNLGGFDGATAIGAKFDSNFLIKSGWNQSEMLAAGWQFKANLLVTTATFPESNPPRVSNFDLAQTRRLSSSATGSNEASQQGQLFNGIIGNTDGDLNDNGEVALNTDNSVTVTFDTSVNTLGYDLSQINSYFGWNPGNGGRSNQGYGIDLTYVDGSTATFAQATHWEPNSPAQYWTLVSFSDENGGVLQNDNLMLNGASSDGTGVRASGVKAVTFHISNSANAGGIVVAREIDIFGTATEPPAPPTTAIEDWRFTHFGTHENSGEAADDFDADGDGVSNLIEYATGSDPNDASDSQAVEVGRSLANPDELVISFNTIADPSLTYLLQASESLQPDDWETLFPTNSGGQSTIVITPSMLSDHSHRFFRLLVTN